MSTDRDSIVYIQGGCLQIGSSWCVYRVGVYIQEESGMCTEWVCIDKNRMVCAHSGYVHVGAAWCVCRIGMYIHEKHGIYKVQYCAWFSITWNI